MTKPINLRQARKRKAREAKAKQAETNRVAHGTPKSIRDLEAARRETLAKQVDGHKLQSPNPEFPDEPGTGEDPGPRSE
jgi:hypothetical protein